MRRVCVVVILTIAGVNPTAALSPQPPTTTSTAVHASAPPQASTAPPQAGTTRPRHRRPALPPPAVSIPQITDPVARALVACLGITPLIHDG